MPGGMPGGFQMPGMGGGPPGAMPAGMDMGAMMGLMQDPEIMACIQKPGVMQAMTAMVRFDLFFDPNNICCY